MLTRKLDNMTNGMLVNPINIMNSGSYVKVDFMFSLVLHRNSDVIEKLSNNWFSRSLRSRKNAAVKP